MDQELYALLYAVAHGNIRNPEQVLKIIREATLALDADYYTKCVELLKFAKGAFLEGWPDGSVRPLRREDETEYPSRVKT